MKVDVQKTGPDICVVVTDTNVTTVLHLSMQWARILGEKLCELAPELKKQISPDTHTNQYYRSTAPGSYVGD
jgi:hypothetical protein